MTKILLSCIQKPLRLEFLLRIFTTCRHYLGKFLESKSIRLFSFCLMLLVQSHGTPLDETNREQHASSFVRDVEGSYCMDHEDVGVATGNWGCGVFGGDPELKSMIQWLAASQVPFLILIIAFLDGTS